MKNSIHLSILTIVFATTVCNAQSWGNNQKISGNGNLKSETRTTATYDEIKVSGFFDVDLIAGAEGQITIEGEENLLPYVIIESENNILSIYTKKGYNIQTNKKVLIQVPFESLNKISLVGSGDVNSKNVIKAENLDIKLTGSGDMKLDIEAKTTEISLSGSGDMVVKGKSDDLTSKVAGSGDIDSYNLITKNADVSVAGSGDLKVFCTESLKARVAGSGDIFYKGNPKTKDTKTAGSGDISGK